MANLPPLSLYIHIPWCVQKCPYCDFNSHALKGEVPHDDYVQHLLNDLRADAQYAQGREIGTIFIGGGTPSLLSGPAMQTLLDGVRACLPLAAGAEITMEANPGTVEADRFVDYQRAGVNRISIGVQSFSEPKLQRLGRIHGPEEAKRAARLASGLGLRSFTIGTRLAFCSGLFRLFGGNVGRVFGILRAFVVLFFLFLGRGIGLLARGGGFNAGLTGYKQGYLRLRTGGKKQAG